MDGAADRLDDDFTGDDMDREVWFPYYLPHWSSRAQSAATYAVAGGELRLSIPPDQGLWCPDRHEEPLRVSCIQTGSFSGPVGSTIGQEPLYPGITVTEEQPTLRGYTPHLGRVAVTMRGEITERSMFACWLTGFQDRPGRTGEICIAEIFGSDIDGEVAKVGMGIKAFDDDALSQEFGTVPLRIDVSADHTYGVDWDVGRVAFHVDGAVVHEVSQAPDYPMQLTVGVFDFPRRAQGAAPDDHVPEMVVSRVVGRTSRPT